MNNYSSLIQKLDEFIRKYYRNQLTKGLIYSIGLLVAFFLVVSVAQYLGEFSTAIRTFLFYSFIGSFISVVGYYIAWPLLKLLKIGSIISHEQASQIIGKHFSSINDKLINTLQLHKLQETNGTPEQNILIEASINQRIKDLKPIPFTNAIDVSKNKKYIKYAAIPVIVLLLILFTKPKVLSDSAKKIITYDTYYEKPAPFNFIVENSALTAVQNADYLLKIKVEGEIIPNEVLLIEVNSENRLEKKDKLHFNYNFKNIQNDISFKLFADGFYSKEYTIKALPNPVLLSYTAKVVYPAYTRKKSEILSNIGDYQAPEGTQITYSFQTKDVDNFIFYSPNKKLEVNKTSENRFELAINLKNSFSYSLKTSNKYFTSKDSINYTLQAIPDQFPTIDAEERKDSNNINFVYFRGTIKDDYGFSKLTFNSIKKEKDGKTSPANQSVVISKSNLEQEYFFAWDLSSLQIKPGDEIEYYFEIFDNDGINGAKSTRSQKFVFKALSEDELAAKAEKGNSDTKKGLQQNLKMAKDIQKEINELNKKILDKKVLSYEEIKRLKDLMQKQKDIEKQIGELQKQNKDNANEQNQFKQPNEELLEKQKQIQDLMAQLLPEELKEKMRELEKLLQENVDKDKIQDALEKLKEDNKDLEKELDRTLEIFKKMEIEDKLKNNISAVEKLAEKQEELAKKTEEKNGNPNELKKEQDALNKEFEELKKEQAELEEKAKELDIDTGEMFGDKMDEKKEDITKEMQNSSEQLANKQNKKASNAQKNAAQKMKQMAAQMSAMASQEEQEEAEEDLKSLRAILENLVKLSFDQEDLMKRFSEVDRMNPQYVILTQEQKKLKDDAKLIEDSLFALSKRQPKIESIVNREIADINSNMQKSIQKMADRQTGEATSRQQYVMTSVNNLALLLNEALEQMQQQMANSKPGSGKCSKPGGSGQGKPKPQTASQMKKMQEKINKEIEKLKQQLELEKAQAKQDGKKPGDKPGQKPGDKPGEKLGEKPGEKGKNGSQGEGGTSEQLAKVAAQQEALRREMQKAAELLNKDGKQGNGQMQKIAEQMEKTESDIVNKNITQETLRRQQEIMTRLLEAEKAERERDEDEKRQSNESKNTKLSNPEQFFEYKLQKLKEAELIRSVPPALIPYYKNKVNEYFNSLNK